MNRRTTTLATAGTLASAALLAGVIAVPSAVADGIASSHRPGGGAEARGVALAAARAAKAGIDWQDCPKGWGQKAPVQCGYVTAPVDYARPDGPAVKLAVDRARSTGSTGERQGSLLYNPGGPGGSGLDFPSRVAEKDPVSARTSKAYDFETGKREHEGQPRPPATQQERAGGHHGERHRGHVQQPGPAQPAQQLTWHFAWPLE